jgi:bacterial/archaeal transporter family protein
MGWFGWALLSAVFAGATAILAKVGVENVDSSLATAVRTTVILAITWTLFLVLSPARSLAQLTPRNWLFLGLSGVATGLSWLCYFRALQLGPASRVAPVDKLSVLFVILFAALFLQEKMSWHTWLGGLLILGGAAVLALRG